MRKLHLHNTFNKEFAEPEATEHTTTYVRLSDVIALIDQRIEVWNMAPDLPSKDAGLNIMRELSNLKTALKQFEEEK